VSSEGRPLASHITSTSSALAVVVCMARNSSSEAGKDLASCVFHSVPKFVLYHFTFVRRGFNSGARRPCNGCKRRLHLQIK
jgi:hypothetical protein